MPRSFLLYFSLASFVLIFWRCANPIAPTGGEKDTEPPRLDSIRSSRNFQTNFQKQAIRLTFDEWVKLEDVFNQVVISPPLNEAPDISLRGKTVKVEFAEDEILKANATYTINFGNSVKDLTEGNVPRDLRFVFSTGEAIDSLSVRGRVIDAFSGEPIENTLFLLYDNLADSVVRTERPFYFGRTNKNGDFFIENVRVDTFKGFALLDANLDYRYDQPGEKIGFPDSWIFVNDTSQNYLSIRLFQETPPMRLLGSEQPHYGLVKLQFNRRPDTEIWRFRGDSQRIFTEFDKDTLRIWYDEAVATNWQVFVQNDSLGEDTILVKVLDKQAFLTETTLTLGQQAPVRKGKGKSTSLTPPKPVIQSISHLPDKPLRLLFSHPISALDTAAIYLYEDTISSAMKPVVTIDSLQRRTLEIRYPWKEDTPYRLEFWPGALTDWFGRQNDTLRQPFTVVARKTLGTIKLIVNGLRADTNYIVQLIGQGGTLIEEFQLKMQGSYQKIVPGLIPGEYAVRLIEDFNSNRRWDSGNYALQVQPEKVFLQKLEPLRANWEVEVKVSTTVFDKVDKGK